MGLYVFVQNLYDFPHMRRWLVCFCALPFFLFCGEMFQMGAGIGYRRDEVGMELSRYSSLDLLNSVVLDGAMRFLWPHVQFSLWVDVGWYVSGNGRNSLTLQAPGKPVCEGRFTQSAGGFFTDGEAVLGYAVHWFSWQLMPQTSFGFFFQQMKLGSSEPSSSGWSGAICSADLTHSRVRRFWFGPGVGVDLLYRPHFAWIFSAGYFYYFLHLDQKFDLFSDLLYLTPQFSEYFIWQKYRASLPAHGQKIYGKISAQIAENWRCNLRFDAYLFSANHTTSLRENVQQMFPLENSFSEIEMLHSKLWWQAYAALLEIEYFF